MFHTQNLVTQHLRYKVITVIHHETHKYNLAGKLPAVTNLFCEQKNLCIECTWARPFSLTQPIHYAINFTTNEENTTTLTTMDTTISHCLCSQYNISVAASNTVGLGNITYYKNVITLMPNCMLDCFYKIVNYFYT